MNNYPDNPERVAPPGESPMDRWQERFERESDRRDAEADMEDDDANPTES